MRFSFCLILGLSVTLMSGCSHCDKCRIPFLKRLNGCRVAKNTDCGCRNDVIGVQNCAVEKPGYGLSYPVVPNPYLSPVSQPETGVIPTQPSHQLRAGKQELGAANTNAPSDKDTASFQPRPSQGETEFRVDSVSPPKSENLAARETADPDQLLLPQLGRTLPILYPEPPAHQVEPATGGDITSIPRPLRALRASSATKVPEPPMVGGANNTPSDTNNEEVTHQPETETEFDYQQDTIEEPIDFRKSPLPAGNGYPIVLRARPTEGYRANNSATGNSPVSASDLANSKTFYFQELPPVEGNQVDRELVFPSTNHLPFEEPSRFNETQGIKALPALNELRNGGSAFKSESQGLITSATSYQTEFTDTVASGKASGSFEEVGNTDASENAIGEDVYSGSAYGQVGARGGIATSSQSADRSSFTIVQTPISQRLEHLQILRLRAVTPQDRAAVVPPVVNLGFAEPVILRGGMHPDVLLPIVKREPVAPRNQPWPNANRLEASRRGLAPGDYRNNNGNQQSPTIDR